MDIKGFQKLTLLDFPGKVACTVFTGGCNFRCPFCHNSSLVVDIKNAPSISQTEIINYLEKRKGILDGVCVSGGEPLMQKNLKRFLTKVKELGYQIKIDTNGSYPDILQSLIDQKLVDYVAMDIKNSPEKYALTTGLANIDLDKIKQSVNILMDSNIDYEFRTTTVKEFHTKQDFEAIAKWLKESKKYFLQNYKDSENVLQKGLHSLSKNELIEAKTILKQYIDNVFIRSE
ncbi:MAG: anaerobic ribonucleoside-triphosphate reductase activating protein [Clostridiales bacterium]|nr:anaerobic ribonucleoside-triphosphate reductase activating protein [Clostridiales bacterium]